MYAYTAKTSVSEMFLAGCKAYWRQLVGTALVCSILVGAQLAQLGYGTAAALTITFGGIATFLACYDFDGARNGVIWTTLMLICVVCFVVSVQAETWVAAGFSGLVVAVLVVRMVRGLLNWRRGYIKAHEVIAADEIVYTETNF